MCRLLSAGSAVRLVKNGSRTRSRLVVAYRSLLTRPEWMYASTVCVASIPVLVPSLNIGRHGWYLFSGLEFKAKYSVQS